MNDVPDKNPPKSTDDDVGFAAMAEQEQLGFFAEFWDFLKYNKKWWLTPLILAIFMMGLLVVASTTGAAPFIYTLF